MACAKCDCDCKPKDVQVVVDYARLGRMLAESTLLMIGNSGRITHAGA